MEENNKDNIPERSKVVKAFGAVILLSSLAMIISHVFVARAFVYNLMDDHLIFAVLKILLLIIMIIIEILLTLFGLYVLYDSKI